MFLSSLGPVALNSNLQNTPSMPVKFGDALFERNSVFETPSKEAALNWQEKCPCLLPVTAKELARIAAQDKHIYDKHQRLIRGPFAIPKALKNASREYQHHLKAHQSLNIPATRLQLAKAGIKLANAQLAADISEEMNEAAFQLLKTSINTLQNKARRNKSQALLPNVIHGYYNRGTYTLNNLIHQANKAHLGAALMELQEATFEGLTVVIPDRKQRLKFAEQITEELPFLDEAIQLAEQIPDHHLAKIEYQIAKGESYHALSHLKADTEQERPVDEDSIQARQAFIEANEILKSIPESQKTSRHQKLKLNLSRIKMFHLCDASHRGTDSTSAYCGPGTKQNKPTGFKPTISFHSFTPSN